MILHQDVKFLEDTMSTNGLRPSKLLKLLNHSVLYCDITFSEMIGLITSGPVLAFEIMGSDAVNQWQALVGPGDSAMARSEAPLSLRAKFGSGMPNVIRAVPMRNL